MSRRRSTGLTPIRVEPRDDAEQVTQALPREPLEVEGERDGWARVRTAYDYPGWVRAESLGPDAGGKWLEAREGDPVEEARAYLGAPYEWGGMTERGIDCSGLKEEAGMPVEPDELRRGGLVCYGDHIAFWLGGGTILHATGRDGVNAVVEEEQPPNLAA